MIIYYSSDVQFELTEEEFKGALTAFNSGKNVWVERLKVHLSPFYKWAGEKPKSMINIGRLHDGSRVKKVNGQWVDLIDSSIKIDPSYYPEIAKDEVMSEEDWQEMNKQKLLN
jgi:hypothetical protein